MGENSTGVPGELRLPKTHLWSIFREAIEAPALAGAQAVERPRVVFLGGQPGCGKSEVPEHIIAGLSNTIAHEVLGQGIV